MTGNVTEGLHILIEAANERLKRDHVKIRIYWRQGTEILNLRGKLPPRPDSGETEPYRQYLPLRLEVSKAGIKEAEVLARKVYQEVRGGYFNWAEYVSSIERIVNRTAADWIEAFYRDWQKRIRQTAKSKETWQDGYYRVYKQLKAERPLDRLNVMQVVERTEPHSRTRQKTCIYLSSLLEFAGANPDLIKEVKSLEGDYSYESVAPQELPTDEEVVYWRSQIENPKHRWMYSMLACYGIRNHELWYCNPESLSENSYGILEILPGAKTNARHIWPFYPQWFQNWELWKIPDLSTSTTTNTAKGELVTRMFERVGIPFTPYALRHAWAVRTLSFNIDVAQSARQMAHSVEIHCKVYHRHIQKRETERAFLIMMGQNQNYEPPSPPPDPPLKQSTKYVHKNKRTPLSNGMPKEEAKKLDYVALPCPHCKSTNGMWKGWAESNGLVWGKRRICLTCGKYQTIPGQERLLPSE